MVKWRGEMGIRKAEGEGKGGRRRRGKGRGVERERVTKRGGGCCIGAHMVLMLAGVTSHEACTTESPAVTVQCDCYECGVTHMVWEMYTPSIMCTC